MITLVLGGARSGKSAVAERLAARMGATVTYVATMQLGDDPELAERVAEHRARRPSNWRTEEAGPNLPSLLRRLEGPAIVDALGGWVLASEDLYVDAQELCTALKQRHGASLVVSEEVGLGVHPSTEEGRRFRDVLGTLNQAVASVADDVLLVVAGRILRLEETVNTQSPNLR
ncbi:MAG: bifunctional adenosylcobinamide kinase/adenosylcobinamide-phosphate guanylyltransferase [Acidimicrobiales bacterium]|jgi:adenosylcobinamide kinase/adenosylcobinamide-phosphate guanylyltransferase